MPRFAANLTMMFTELPFTERFAAAARAGFAAVEFLFPYDYPVADVTSWLNDAGLKSALFNMPPGDWAAGERGIASIPGREGEFRAGVAKALELALLGDKLSATDAELSGLIARCVPAEQLMSAALGAAQRLAALPTRALVATRKRFDDAMQQGFEPALRAESKQQSLLGFSHDYNEGVTAFLEKRPAQFRDR